MFSTITGAYDITPSLHFVEPGLKINGEEWANVMGVTGDLLFVISATCPLLSCSDVGDCHAPFSTVCITLCSDDCLAQGQSVNLHFM